MCTTVSGAQLAAATLDRLLHHDESAIGTRNTASNQDQALGLLNRHNSDILNGRTQITALSRHLLVFDDATWVRAHTDGALVTELLVTTVTGLFRTSEVVSLERSGESATFGCALT